LHKRLVQGNPRGLDLAVKEVACVAEVFEGENDRVFFRVVKLDELSVEQLRAQLVLAEREAAD